MPPPDKQNPKKSEKITMNLISQDDHLAAGAWAACGVCSNKLFFSFSQGEVTRYFRPSESYALFLLQK